MRLMARTLLNEGIVAAEVVLIDEEGHDRGIVARSDALALARARGCDLVQEAMFSSPPRCRLVPAGRADAAAARAARLSSSAVPKEIRVGTAMGAHDVETRRRQAAGLLDKGYSVKLSARLAKAERSNPVAARALLDGLIRDLAPHGAVARKPFNEAGALAVLLSPRDD